MKKQKHISIIVPAGESILSSVIGPYKIFNAVNGYLMQTGQAQAPVFQVQLVGLTAETSLYNGAFSIRPNLTIDQVKKTDLIIIPALSGNIPEELKRNEAFLPWITDHYKQGTEVVSLCMGAFLLASTGLLKGEKCTTHWMGADAFRQMFPDVDLVTEKIITDQNGIYTSGGAYSFLNMIIYLVEKYCGRHVAIFCSKLFEIEIDRYDQLQFTIFNGQKEHSDELIRGVQLFIEQHYTEKLTVDQLADKFSISRRNFERRFKKACGNSPIEYIQRVKIEAAKKSLESTRENINEVMYGVGYSDSKSFRATFKKNTGLSPIEYKQKYNREMASA
jgi:transcriptional regulator GlxA family with amidase domain